MKTLLHFAKIFGIVWGVLTMLNLIALLSGMNLVVASYGTTRPSPWVMEMIFFSVVPALLIAGLWEILRVVRLHMVQ